ncbi:MAG: hypothetical protein IKS70_00805, partial [Bacteroides sp.]|nr:hypothetical protein [Bacteroides sp.]
RRNTDDGVLPNPCNPRGPRLKRLYITRFPCPEEKKSARERDRRLLLPKMRGGVLPGGYLLNAAVYGGRTEGKRAFQAGCPRPA